MLDLVCPRCGQIHHVNVNGDAALCDCAAYRGDPNPLGLLRVSRAYVDGVMWERIEHGEWEYNDQ